MLRKLIFQAQSLFFSLPLLPPTHLMPPPPTSSPLLDAGDARKASAGHVEVEAYLKAQGLPFTVFQPLYIYGPLTAKDCEQWFVDRVIRDR